MDPHAGAAPGGVIAKAGAVGPVVSLALHLGLLAAAVISSPSLGETDTSSEPTADRYLIAMLMIDNAERELDDQDVFIPATQVQPEGEDRGVEGAEGQARPTGDIASQAAAGRMSAVGSADNPDAGPWRRGDRLASCCMPPGPATSRAGEREGLAVKRHLIGRDPASARGNQRGMKPADAAGPETDPARLSTRGWLSGEDTVTAEPPATRRRLDPPAVPAPRLGR